MVTYGALAVAFLALVSSGAAHDSPFACSSEGRHLDPEDCTKYFVCRMSSNGTYSHEHKSCNGLPFHPEKKICVIQKEVPTCQSRDSRQFSSSGPSEQTPDYECTEDGFFCLDCSTVIGCTNGVAYYEDFCALGDTCQNRESFGSFTCYTAQEEADGTCACSAGDSYIQDAYNSQKFSYCLTSDSAPVFKHCNGDMVFDIDMQACVNNNGAPECQSSGRFPNPVDCAKFYNCIPVRGGQYEQIFHDCDEGEMFNEQAKSCSDPCTWPNPNFECSTEGRYGDPMSCNNYYVCTEYPKESGQYLKKHRECPLEYHWDQTALGGKGNCAHPGNMTTPCMEAQEGRCPIPDSCFSEDSSTDPPSSAPEETPTAPGPSPTAPDAPTENEETPEDPTGPVSPPRRRKLRLDRESFNILQKIKANYNN